MQTYYATGGANGTPNWNKGSAALRPALAGDAIEEAFAWGTDRDPPVPVPGLEDQNTFFKTVSAPCFQGTRCETPDCPSKSFTWATYHL